ncbi:MAG: hypothetical protein IPM20_07525 [Gammaproteobacteria bacterium]|nr:hypothetical protein [Gammaproteobacteria bacterium]
MADLSQRGLIGVHGADARKFLQGQLTNDIDLVVEGCSQLNGCCSPKGRLLALLRVFRRDDSYYLLLPRTLLGDTLARLKKYVMISKVTLEDLGRVADRRRPHRPPRRGRFSGTCIGTGPARRGRAGPRRRLTVMRVPGAHARASPYGPPADMERLDGAGRPGRAGRRRGLGPP